MSHPNHQKNSHDAPRPTSAMNAGNRGANDMRSQPATDHIRLRAFEISQTRNGGPGDELADWIQAEREVKTRLEAKH